ncbi:hypothetical protein DMC47_27550 [Nostoc sp. 3335mG]|nr:hypothetical protein DMC47_27550 [Nostoc sp. 3335mG]
MKAPLASTGLMALVTMSALAGSNALYFQTVRHPSPFFSTDPSVPRAVPVTDVSAPVPAPAAMREQAVADAPAPVVAPVVAAPETTGSVAAPPPAIPEAPVGNAEVFAVQKKLAELNLFAGKVDGYYGPMTASAIRTFEQNNGFDPMGALTPEVAAAILGADAAGRAAAPAAVAQPAPQPQATAAPVAAPAAPTVQLASAAPVQQPVAQPQPVPAAAPQPQQDQVVARLPPLSPVEQAVDTVGIAAASTIDSIIAAVDGARTPTPVSNPPIPTASVPTQAMPAKVTTPAAQPAVVQQASTSIAPPAVTTTPSQQSRAARPATDKELVADIQRGLASLGFFRGNIDGNPGPETARAIREFENFHRYKITGQVQPDLVDLLRSAGAAI